MSGIGNVGGGSSRPIEVPEPDTSTNAPPAAAPPSATPAGRTTATATGRPASTTATSGSPAALLSALPVGTLEGSGRTVSFDPARGTFAVQDPRTGRTETGPEAVYAAAQLVAAGKTELLTNPALGATGRQKLATALEALIAQGAASTRQPPSQEDLRARSGAATVGLAFAKSLPAGDPLAGRVLAAYTRQMKGETFRGLQASMALNLEASGLRLDATARADIAAAKAKTMPTAPPYAEWFKNDPKLDVKHYIHPERWPIYTGGYEQAGFKKTVVSPSHWIYEKTFTDPSGKNPPTPVRIDCRKTEEDTFRDMDDAGVEIELYSGHSNLGGNILGALSEAPDQQRGAKWVINWMCRGKQVLNEVYNKFPDAHYMTTDVAVNAYDGPPTVNAIFEGIARREGYRYMDRKADLDTQLIFPDDKRVLDARDDDRDGVATVRAGGVDPLYNIGLARTTERTRDLKPEATGPAPADLPGDKVMKAVNFFNTLYEYHHEHGPDGRTNKAAADNILADGWFAGTGDEVVRVEESKVGGETYYKVKVNSRYANQDGDAIGAAVAYELNKHLSLKQNGAYTEQDKLRGGLFAGLYVSYMVETLEEAEDVMAAVGKKYGFPSRFGWANVEKAIDEDDHGYGSRTSQEALKRKIGTVDPRNG